MTVELVRINAGNTSLLGAVADEVFDEPIVAARVAAYLANPDNLLIVAIKEAVAVGMVMGVVHRHPDKPNELYIDEVGVTPGLRRQGVARALMDAMIEWGEQLACEDAWLGTEIDNEAARALYRRYTKGEAIMLFEWELGV